MNERALIFYLKQLTALLNAGVKLNEASEILATQQKDKAVRRILYGIYYEVNSGQTLADSYKAYPTEFPNILISMIQVGEKTGDLRGAVKKIVDYTISQQKANYDERLTKLEEPKGSTFVDENDKVVFYNRGEDRVFPRSKGIIGREVKFCHPPKSVDMVLRIVEEFKAGTKDVAEFWFNFKGQAIHVRYFAIRDNNKQYKGVIEMSQDITDIQKLEGQKRLLDWD